MTILGLRPLDTPAIIDGADGQEITFRRLLGDAVDLLGALAPARRTLFVLARNDRFTLSAYAGAMASGIPVALLDGSRPLEASARVLQTYRPDGCAGPEGTGAALAALGVPVERVRSVDGGELVLLGDRAEVTPHPDLALLLSTSGTTGSQKLVRLSAANVDRNATAIAACLGLTPAERPLTSLPFQYTFGLSVLNSHWSVGAPVVLTAESVLRPRFWDLVREHACTSFAGVPFTFQMLERVGFRDMDLPSLRTVQQAGGALDRRLTELYATHLSGRGARLVVMYGQTEATARMAWVPPGRLPEKMGSAGTAIPGGRFRIEPSTEPSAEGHQVGEVVYEGPNVMLGYADNAADLVRGDDLGGVLRTGDIGYLDTDGFLWLTGRSKRIAKVYGLRINLDEFELAVREHGPAVAVGGEDVIWVFCAFGEPGQLTDLAQELARRYRIHPSTIRLRHTDEIPLTPSGKVDYQQVGAWTRA